MKKLGVAIGLFLFSATGVAETITGSSLSVPIDLTREWNLMLNKLHKDREEYYPFSGDLLDYSGKKRHVNNSQSAAITFGKNHEGIADAAAVFTGNSCYAHEPEGWSVTNNLTIAAWIRSSTNLVNTGYAVFPTHGGNDNVTGVGLRYGTNGLSVVEHKGGYLKATLVHTANLGTGWHHVAITVNDNGAPQLYVDGAYVAEGEDSGNKKKISNACTIGGGAYGSFRGSMSDVVFYSRALTASEIVALFQASTFELCAEDEQDVITTSGTENIVCSTSWETTDDSAIAELAVNGSVINSVGGSGVYDWMPTINGTYTLTHKVKVGNDQVGNTLTATFVVSGLDPIPYLGENPTDAQVATAITGSADTRLSHYVTNGVAYVAYRSWATNVQQMVGGLAGTKAVHDSPHAWLSYALDSAVLVTNAPVQGEMRIASFEKNAITGKFDFLVAVDGMTVGAKVLPEKLATLFSVVGCGTVDGDYKVDNVTILFDTPVDGKVRISVAPFDSSTPQFFLKVKMTP